MAGTTKFTRDVADSICEQIAEGMSIRTICKDESMPSMSTVFKWLSQQPSFAEQYARAKEAQADAFAEEILDIADDGTNDWVEIHGKDGDSLGWRENGEAIRRSVLRVDSRKWLMGKLKPKKYGDRVQAEVTGADGGPIQTAIAVTFVKTDAGSKG